MYKVGITYFNILRLINSETIQSRYGSQIILIKKSKVRYERFQTKISHTLLGFITHTKKITHSHAKYRCRSTEGLTFEKLMKIISTYAYTVEKNPEMTQNSDEKSDQKFKF